MTVTTGTHTIDFSFPEVHDSANLQITFHRTLRVPDDDTAYGLPPSLGDLDIRSAHTIDAAGLDGTDAVLPMWQSEATWMSFSSPARYPFLVKAGIGGINAVTGGNYSPSPDFSAEDYFEVPEQPWLDGFRVDATTVRQFVAMPLGDGYSVAEQLTGTDDGLIRFSVVPLRADVWDQRPPAPTMSFMAPPAAVDGMGLGAGGSIDQSIAAPVEPHENWCRDVHSEFALKIVNSLAWQALTGEPPHSEPLTIDEYLRYGFPWFTWYDDSLARQGDTPLSKVRTVREVGESKGTQPLPDNTSFTPPKPSVVGGF